jgi:P-type Cu+ transporter
MVGQAKEDQAMTSSTPAATAIDPVCGMEVEVATAKHLAEYRGRTYRFCSLMCKHAFEDDPERYLRGKHGDPAAGR